MSGDRFDKTVVSERDLLALTHSADLDELAALVDGDSDVDVWLVASQDGVEVGVGSCSTLLIYPFFLDEFYEVVDEGEREQIRRWEAEDEGESSPP